MQRNTEFFKKRYDLLAQKVIQNLKSRHFEAYYCETTEDAVEKALSLIPAGDSVTWGGSMTLIESGLLDRVKQGDYQVIDRGAATTPEERMALMRKAFTCDTYLTSINRVSEDGVLVNVDGYGNRVAAITFGPRKVIAVVGMNKVAKTVDDALEQVRNVAAPVNVLRLGNDKTPCSTTGSCANCKTPQSICATVVCTRLCKEPGRIKVILVGEDIGY
jgi:L-lactate utilization protein LutB